MGLFKDLIKIGVGGVVAGAVINSAINNAKKTPEERFDEKRYWLKNSFDFKKVLNISPKKIDKVFDFLCKSLEKSNYKILEKDKPNEIIFNKGSVWTGKQRIVINLEKIEGKILINIVTKFHWSGVPEGRDYREFVNESESLTNILDEIFK